MPQRTRFVALENAYHGETAGALSVGDLDLYAAPYRALCFPKNKGLRISLVDGETFTQKPARPVGHRACRIMTRSRPDRTKNSGFGVCCTDT